MVIIIILIIILVITIVYSKNKETFMNCYDYVKENKKWSKLLRSEIFTLLTLKPEKGTMYNNHEIIYPNDGSCIIDETKLPFYNIKSCSDINMPDCKIELRDEIKARGILSNIYQSYTSIFEKQIANLTNIRDTLEKQYIDLQIKNDNLKIYIIDENKKIEEYNCDNILSKIKDITTRQENVSNQLANMSLQQKTSDDTLKHLNTLYQKYNILLNSRDPSEIQSTLANYKLNNL